MYARPFIDSLDFAENGREINGEVPLADLPRLLDVLENPEGFLSYTVRGGVDRQGVPLLYINVAGSCRLRCQRCLNGMDYTVQIDARLLLRDQAALDALDDNVTDESEEEFDSILTDARMDVLNLIEEEILLSLPIAPKHEPDACQMSGDVGHKDAKHPFATLAKLKVIK